MAVDPKYEFDALQFVDFAAPSFLMGSDGPEESELNQWFGKLAFPSASSALGRAQRIA